MYKNFNANTTKVTRVKVSLEILGAHYQNFDWIYIDETSFNLQNWPLRGWARIGSHPRTSNPTKSKNYSAIMAMDLNGILSFKVVKGGVKGPDFFLFLKNLLEAEAERFKSKRVILFMDNASIHKSKDYMKKLTIYYNIFYNAPYTPQLNPIEFMFGKLKNLVKKSKPRTEKQLLKAIIKSCNQITKENAAEYMIHSLKFLKQAIDREDFFQVFLLIFV